MFAKLQELREEREQGFTLIELLVVILIIGILAAIAIPMFLNQRKSAVDSSVQSDIKNAATIVETWMVKNPATAVPSFTLGDDGLTTTPSRGTTTNADLLAIKVGAGTEISVTPGTVRGTYKITGTNAGGDLASKYVAAAADPDGTGPLTATPESYGYTYDSANGGLK